MNELEQEYTLLFEEIKQKVCDELQLSLVAFHTWIEPMKFYKVENDTFFIEIPTEKAQLINYLIKNYKDIFHVCISDATNHDYEIRFIVKKDEEEMESKNNSVANYTDLYKQANLVSKYTFENFVVGSNNSFAHSASLAVAENPGEDFNPLFIYGGSGLGKTHLMHSIGHYIIDHNPEKKVLYVNSETFTNEVIEGIRSGNSAAMNRLRDKYRTVDVLLIDDIQFIIGKESTQEEFFHTFNALHDNGKAVIISSDKPPKQMETLDERFSSRFGQGLQADIQPPSYETRAAILLMLAEPYNNTISAVPQDVIEYIATNVNSNIRELEGAFNKVVYYSKINKKPITLEMAEEALKDIIYPDAPKMVTPQIIIQVVADHFGIKAEDITSKKRTAEIVIPRQVVMYLCRELTDISLKNIAKVLDKKDHSTIINGITKIQDEINNNSEFANQINIIKKKITPT
ncbi:MAG: chromosomal replication initiator protein DnaA [Lachnospiraceae bacterium]|nr:chromosomal replication initiator protein DnaA [Lachnospiraceae bacterium]